MYTLLKQDGHAPRGTFETVHGTVQTPAFMNVGTSAAIKGGISSTDLVELKCQIICQNTIMKYITVLEIIYRKAKQRIIPQNFYLL